MSTSTSTQIQQAETSFAVFNANPIVFHPHGFDAAGWPTGEQAEMTQPGYPAEIEAALITLVERDFDCSTCHAPGCSEGIGAGLYGEADERVGWSFTAAWSNEGTVRLLCEEHHLEAVEEHPSAIEHDEF